MIYILSNPQISRNCKLKPTKISYQNYDPASWNQLMKVQQICPNYSIQWMRKLVIHYLGTFIQFLLVDYKLLVSKQSSPLLHLYRSIGRGGGGEAPPPYYLSSIRARGLKKNSASPLFDNEFPKVKFRL